MSIERASIKAVPKPWGSTDLRPWSNLAQNRSPIGELWFERAAASASEPALLLKLLFTTQPLSIQVHPDDEYARSVGLPHGKTEAWYIVAAAPDARIALGLEHIVPVSKLRAAIEDGSIAELVHWQHVQRDEAVLVPAGTIHAIGAGLVIAEIQQRSDATFRLFDYGSHRELHVEDAARAAFTGPALPQIAPTQLSMARRLLAVSPYFVFERVDLPASSSWEFDLEGEGWVLALSGEATFASSPLSAGEAIFVDSQSVSVHAGDRGLNGLIAYVGTRPSATLLRCVDSAADHAVDDHPPETQEALQ